MVKTRNLAFSPQLDELVSSGQTIDRDGNKVAARGLSTINNLVVLRNLHLSLRAAATLEVGLAYGASALVFAQSHKDLGSAPQGQHVAIDPFQNHVGYAGLRILQRAALSAYVHHMEDFSSRVLPRLADSSQRYNLIYVDGSHLFEDVFVDCHYATQLLAQDGVILFDDSSDPHVAKVLKFVERNMGHVLHKFDLSPFRADEGRSLRYRLGGLLGRVQLSAFRKSGEERRPWNSRFVKF